MTELVRISAGLSPGTRVGYDRKVSPTLFRHYTAVREFLGIQTYIGTDANEITVRAARDAAETMDQPVDIINATIDALVLRQIELPAFSTLDTIAEQVHARTQTALFRRIARRLSQEEQHRLDRLLTRDFASRQTAYHNIKHHAQRPSRKHLTLLIEHLTWLDTIGDFSKTLVGVPASKLRSLASQAMSLDAANLKEILPEKRYTLMVALLNHARAGAGRLRRNVHPTHECYPQAGTGRVGANPVPLARADGKACHAARRCGRYRRRGRGRCADR
nr:DUF4158 domain-containing protein [Cupriavidus necator]